MKRFFKWCTDYYCMRITFIVISVLMFIIGYFTIFLEDWKNDPASILIPYFSATLAVIVGFIFEILNYSFILVIIFLRSGNIEFKRIIDRPKYLTISWWKEDFGYRIVGGALTIIAIIFSVYIICTGHHSQWTFSIFWGCLSVFIIFPIAFAWLIALIYNLVALAISSIHAKITGKNLKHLAR